MGKRIKKNKKYKFVHNGPPMAETADKYVLYQRSVQNAEAEIELLAQFYKEAFGEEAVSLREDFGGTHAVCCEWVKTGGRLATAIDLDPEPIAWGQEHNQRDLTEEQKSRLTVIEGDVRTNEGTPADIVGAMNFSYFIFKSRQELLKYFKAAYENLNENGVFCCDIFGGYETFEDDREEQTVHSADEDNIPFTYCWDQDSFNPINHNYLFKIHFRFPDGTALEDAFTYDWRMWSIPEVRELMIEAGFTETKVYWEGEDEDGDGNGVFTVTEVGDSDPGWVAYVVGVKK